MDRRIVAVACIIAILICTTVFFLTRPITGTWVCTKPITEHEMLTDEVTIITIQQDGTADFRSYATYFTGRYTLRDGTGRWEPAGLEQYRITITQGYGSSCTQFENCTIDNPPFIFTVGHDRIRDMISYTQSGVPLFSGRWPFVRSIGRD